MADIRYPIGPEEPKTLLGPAERRAAIEQLARLPAELRVAVSGLTAEQLDTAYRPGGWTVRQVTHHLADALLNGYVRFKLAITEEQPTIKPYDQEAWATLIDCEETPVEVSLSLLDALHQRWVTLLESMPSEEFARRLHHPERGTLTLDGMLAHYAWHGRHHVAHITSLRDRNDWR